MPADPVQSELTSQTTYPEHDEVHVVPVKPDHSLHVLAPHVVGVTVPVAQQILPFALLAQSIASPHCQSTEPATGHAVPIGSHVDGVPAEEGVSQQCWPAAQVMFLPPSAALKGQYTPAEVSG